MSNNQSIGPHLFSHEDDTTAQQATTTAAGTDLRPKFLAAPSSRREND